MASSNVKLHNYTFEPYIAAERINARVAELGKELGKRFKDGKPSFLIMLKGAFVFAADLIRASRLGGEICFVRTKSYSGTQTDGRVELLLAPEEHLVRDHDVILIEDIVDSGYTMQAFLPILKEMQPRSVTLVTLLHKPAAQKVEVPIDLIGFSIPPDFVVGYGLDYDGLGRQLPAIYKLSENY